MRTNPLVLVLTLAACGGADQPPPEDASAPRPDRADPVWCPPTPGVPSGPCEGACVVFNSMQHCGTCGRVCTAAERCAAPIQLWGCVPR